jgi:hypothetical protein
MLLLVFAVAYGAFVAYSHMMELRYTAPITPFIIVAAALFYAWPAAPRE